MSELERLICVTREKGGVCVCVCVWKITLTTEYFDIAETLSGITHIIETKDYREKAAPV